MSIGKCTRNLWVSNSSLRRDFYWHIRDILVVSRCVSWCNIGNSVDVALCTVNYNTNKCGTHFIPDLMERCAAWKACKDTNPESVSRTRITAQLLSDISAQLVEGFLGQLSLPTLVRKPQPKIMLVHVHVNLSPFLDFLDSCRLYLLHMRPLQILNLNLYNVWGDVVMMIKLLLLF